MTTVADLRNFVSNMKPDEPILWMVVPSDMSKHTVDWPPEKWKAFVEWAEYGFVDASQRAARDRIVNYPDFNK